MIGTGFSQGQVMIDVVACSQVIIGSSGSVNIDYAKGGRAVVRVILLHNPPAPSNRNSLTDSRARVLPARLADLQGSSSTVFPSRDRTRWEHEEERGGSSPARITHGCRGVARRCGIWRAHAPGHPRLIASGLCSLGNHRLHEYGDVSDESSAIG